MKVALKGSAMVLCTVAMLLLHFSCVGPKPGSHTKTRPPASGKPPAATRPAMDTIRWKPAPPGTPPPIGRPGASGQGGGRQDAAGTEYRVALLLPFLSDQFDPVEQQAPEKSGPALQFYAGAQLALQKLSAGTPLKLSVEVVESYVEDAAFLSVLNSGVLDKSQVIIGPLRSSQVEMLADKTGNTRQILVSPIVPTSGLAQDNPGFVQLNPSLRAHCAAITRYARSRMQPDQIVLVCKEKEANRLPYFQDANAALGGARLRELILADESVNFDKADLQTYLRDGKKTAFLAPSWASQDFIMAFFTKLLAVKGAAEVEVYGMPQWENFENIEPEYLRKLNVHISSATWIDRSRPDVQEFERQFLNLFGTIPDEYAFHGYDAMLFTGVMLRRSGLGFPERLPDYPYTALRGNWKFERINNSDTPEKTDRWDYLENTAVRILKFEKFGFQAVE